MAILFTYPQETLKQLGKLKHIFKKSYKNENTNYILHLQLDYLYPNPITVLIIVKLLLPIMSSYFLSTSVSLRQFEKKPGNSTTFCHHLQTKYNQTSQNQVETMYVGTR